ncbi:hypothetical protein Gorai_017049, partial [Gossypium raimondii]|nr:hypothetical protein [Gossypium raimondii]
MDFYIASDKETLWVQVIRSKYRLNGNGSKIRCWKDNWVPRVRPLIKFIPANVNIDSDYLLNEMVTEEERLLSNMERVKRGLIVNPSCPICGNDLEDILHIIRDCTAAKAIWRQVIQNFEVSWRVSSSSNVEVMIREHNQVANCLAKLALDNKEDLQVFDSPPKEILALIDSDKS